MSGPVIDGRFNIIEVNFISEYAMVSDSGDCRRVPGNEGLSRMDTNRLARKTLGLRGCVRRRRRSKGVIMKIIADRIRKLLIFHCVREYFRMLKCCLTTFGFGMWFFYFLVKIPAQQLYICTTMFLDNIFFPGYRRVKIEKPLFIIGHPRSATTFLHEVLTSTAEFMVFKHWETYHPALVTRKLFQRHRKIRLFFSLISNIRFTPNRIKKEIREHKGGTKGKFEEHKERSEVIAQEEEELFFNVLDTQFIALGTPIGFSDKKYPELVYHDDQPHQEKSVRFLKNCFKRQIYYTGNKQVFAKINFSLFRIKTIFKYFPDAKFIFVMRSPLDTMPSHLTTHYDVLDRHYGLDNIPKDKLELYLRTRYHYNLEFYKYFVELLNNGEIPKEQFLLITYNEIKKDLGDVVERIKSFTDVKFSSELDESLKKRHDAQPSYRRPHRNLPLEAFNLTEEQVRSDFDFVFKQYELE